jgi:hypothetical protein
MKAGHEELMAIMEADHEELMAVMKQTRKR